MFKAPVRLPALGAVCLLAVGCGGGSYSFSYNEERPVRETRVHTAHVCNHDCHHHYYDGTRLVVLRGHRHSRSCGHHWNGAHWVAVKRIPTRTRVAHVCTRECHHHCYDGTRLVVLKGHRHGRGCGHRWNGTHWLMGGKVPTRTRVAHVCTRACHHHYHNGTKLVVLKGHRHGRNCGHSWSGKRWILTSKPKIKSKTVPSRRKPDTPARTPGSRRRPRSP